MKHRIFAVVMLLAIGGLPAAPDARAADFVCGGVDDTSAIRAAVKALPPGGLLQFSATNCVVTDTIVLPQPITIAGVGVGTQIYGTKDLTLFQITGPAGVLMRDLYLGSSSFLPGVSLIEVNFSHDNEFRNITLLGGYWGVHLIGAVANTFVDLRSGVNIGGFFGQTSSPNYPLWWVMSERLLYQTGVSLSASNANVFIAPMLVGGMGGILAQDQAWSSCTNCIRGGEGSIQIIGGVFESIAGPGVVLDRLFHPSTITGAHFEKNQQDIVVRDTFGVRISGVYSEGGIDGISGGIVVTDMHGGNYTRNIEISDSVVEQIVIASNAKQITLRNVVTDIECKINDNSILSPWISPAIPTDPTFQYIAIRHNCT